MTRALEDRRLLDLPFRDDVRISVDREAFDRLRQTFGQN